MLKETQNSILIVEDSPDKLELMSFILRQVGYQVVTASDGQQGLEIARSQPPDLIISDVSMPRMDGIELCRRMRADEKLQAVPLMLVSGLRKDTESVSEGLQAGADDYLEAPYEAERLIAKVRRLLARHESEKALQASRQQLQFITDTAPAYIFHCDTQRRYKFVNRRYANRFEVRPKDVVGRLIVDLLGAKAYASIEQYVSKALSGESVEFETEIPYEQLGKRYMHCAYVPEFGARGEVKGFVAVITDVTERRRVEEALREGKQSLVRAQQVAHIGNWDWDMLTGNVYWSDEMYRIYGVSQETFTPTFDSVMRFVHPDDLGVVNRTLESVLKELTPSDIEYRIIRPDGTVREVSGQAEVYSEEARAVRMVGTVQDITERRRAEELLRENQELFRSAFDYAAVGMALVSIDGRWLKANRSMCQIVGYSEQELLTTTFQAITHPDDLAADLDYLRQLLGGEILSYQMEKRYRHKLGHFVWVLLSVSLVQDAQGNPQYFVSQVQDITERKRAEEALLESEAKLSGIIESAMDAIITVDADQNIVLFNQAAEQMFQCSAEEVMGRALDRFIPQSFRESHRRHIRDFGKTGVISRAMAAARCVSGLRADGTQFPLEASISQIEAQGEKLYTVILRDISQRMRAEKYLIESSEQLRALSARLESVREEEGVRIARELHDELGGALTVLRWDLQSVSQKLANIDIESGTRAHVQGKIESMNDLIDSSLETVRRISSELRPTVLDDLGLAEAIQWKARQFQSRTGITTMCHSLAEVEGVRGAPALAVYRILQEALTNVLRHAQATRIDLFISSKDGEFTLEVRDNGRGISEKESDITRSLGLLGMRERAQFVGGQFSITGTPGKGTTVIVRVPLDGATREL